MNEEEERESHRESLSSFCLGPERTGPLQRSRPFLHEDGPDLSEFFYSTILGKLCVGIKVHSGDKRSAAWALTWPRLLCPNRKTPETASGKFLDVIEKHITFM